MLMTPGASRPSVGDRCATRSFRNTRRSALHHYVARLERSEATSRQSGWPAALQRVRMLERAQAVDGWDGTEVVRVSERNQLLDKDDLQEIFSFTNYF